MMSSSNSPRRHRQRTRSSSFALSSKSISKNLNFQASSYRSFDHPILDALNSAGWIQALGAHIHAIHDGMAAEQAIRIFEVVQPFRSRLVAAVGNEAVRLQQSCRSYKLVRIPPE